MNIVVDLLQIIMWLLVLLIVLVLILVAVIFRLLKNQQQETTEQMNTFLKDINSQVMQGLGSMTEQFGVFGELNQKLGELSTVGKQVDELTTILRNTHQRGIWGEQILSVLLDNLFPNYHGPHTFNDGKRVEEVLKLPDGKIVAIDSKFTVDSFHRLQDASSERERKQARSELTRALRERIDETKKYIRPSDGTLDFALMFLPAESVYYELICNDALSLSGGKRVWDYALEEHVIPVSPNTLYAYLTVIVYGLRGLQIEQRTKELLSHLLQLEGDFKGIIKNWSILGTHLSHAKSKYDSLDKSIDRFSNRLNTEEIPGLQSDESSVVTKY